MLQIIQKNIRARLTPHPTETGRERAAGQGNGPERMNPHANKYLAAEVPYTYCI